MGDRIGTFDGHGTGSLRRGSVELTIGDNVGAVLVATVWMPSRPTRTPLSPVDATGEVTT